MSAVFFRFIEITMCSHHDISQDGFNEPLPRPDGARAIMEYSPETLSIIVPSEMFDKSPGEKRFIVAGMVSFCIFVCGFVGWMTYSAIYGCRIYWESFDFWPALGCTVLTFVICFAMLYMLLLPLYVVCSQLARWQLVLSKNEIRFEYRAWFNKQTFVVPCSTELVASPGDNKYINRQQLALRYWLVYNRAFEVHHKSIRINTEPLIVFPCANESECVWLLQILNEFIRRCHP